MSHRLTAAARLLPVLLGGACTPVGVPGVTALRTSWLFGVQHMQDDPGPQLPYTNRFIADLAAMPSVRVVYVGDERNQHAFDAWTNRKVLVAPWLHGEGNCMNITYTLFLSGQQQAVFGLVIPTMFAGAEPDSACVDRAASDFYRALVLQGL